MSVKARQEVGEIDTKAPFQSVKAAVSLFGEGVCSSENLTLRKAKSPLKESIVVKETQLLLAQEELRKLKEQLKNAETTKVKALVELDSAKQAVRELTNKLNTINESKELAPKTTEDVNSQTMQYKDPSFNTRSGNDVAGKHELNCVREQYVVAIAELDAAKQELSRIRKDFRTSMDAKVSALEQAAEAKQFSDTKTEKATQLSGVIATVKQSLLHVKHASVQSLQEKSNILCEKDASKQSYRQAVEETENKLVSLKKEIDPKQNQLLESKLAEINAEIGIVQKAIETARTSDVGYVTIVKAELDSAKEVLHKVEEEESSLKSLVKALKLEFDALRKEHAMLRQKDAETECTAGDLSVRLLNCKTELEAAMAMDSKASFASDYLKTDLPQLSLETANARAEAQTMARTAEELRNEAETTRLALDEAEKKLQVALKDAAGAKAEEVKAVDQIKSLSEKADAVWGSTLQTNANIRIPKEEYESLIQKVEECKKLADTTVATAMVQVESVRISENEAIKILESAQKEMEDLEVAIEEAIKGAEMSEAAKRALEGELRRLHEKEQKRAAKAASWILAEERTSTESFPPRAGLSETDSVGKTQADERFLRSVSKKKAFGGIFHRRSQSLSHLLGELPV